MGFQSSPILLLTDWFDPSSSYSHPVVRLATDPIDVSNHIGTNSISHARVSARQTERQTEKGGFCRFVQTSPDQSTPAKVPHSHIPAGLIDHWMNASEWEWELGFENSPSPLLTNHVHGCGIGNLFDQCVQMRVSESVSECLSVNECVTLRVRQKKVAFVDSSRTLLANRVLTSSSYSHFGVVEPKRWAVCLDPDFLSTSSPVGQAHPRVERWGIDPRGVRAYRFPNWSNCGKRPTRISMLTDWINMSLSEILHWEKGECKNSELRMCRILDDLGVHEE